MCSRSAALATLCVSATATNSFSVSRSMFTPRAERLYGALIPTSSTSKMSVAPGGITRPAPRSP
jgi:hypothetical protein